MVDASLQQIPMIFYLFSYAAAPFAGFLCANLAARELGFNI